MSIDGIRQGQPIGDGLPGRPAWSPPGAGQEGRDGSTPLLPGKDRLDRSDPVETALGVLRDCLQRSIAGAFGVEEFPDLRGPLEAVWAESAQWVQVWTPESLAADLASKAGQMCRILEGHVPGNPHARIERASSEGVAFALDTLESLGLLEGEAGAAVFRTLELWGTAMARLVQLEGGDSFPE